ncbi:DUF4253 domain-containing protein [Chitinophagaceae bacterium LWZ2-11]
MAYDQFYQIIVDQILLIYPDLKFTVALNDNEVDISFKEEDNYTVFKDKKIEGIQFLVQQDKRDEIVKRLQKELGSEYIVYFSEQNFGHSPDKITILQTSDKYDALRFEGCNGVNYDIYVEDIIANLQELESVNAFVLIGVGFDFVQGEFKTPPTNVEDMANQMYEFCPDIVEQGTGDVDTLIKEIKNSNTFYYWWD